MFKKHTAPLSRCSLCSMWVLGRFAFDLWSILFRKEKGKKGQFRPQESVNLRITYSNVSSRVSSGIIVSDYGLDDRAIGVRFPAGARNFSCILCVQTGSGAHPASCTMGTGGPSPWGKSAAGA
jgi:hypothetical protein